MNANLKDSSAIAAQPDPSAAVSKFLARKPQLFINNEWIEARSGKIIKVYDPATGREIGQVADAGADEVNRGVATEVKSVCMAV